MSDLISREALINELRKDREAIYSHVFCHTDCQHEEELALDLEQFIENQPTVEAIQTVHGEWVNEYINRYGHPCHCCSVCGFHASYQDKNFCPECGADMRKRVN